MKKLIGALMALAIGVAVIAPSAPAEAQVIIYTTACCDGGNYVRCAINPTPVGNPCFCYGQGWGHAC